MFRVLSTTGPSWPYHGLKQLVSCLHLAQENFPEIPLSGQIAVPTENLPDKAQVVIAGSLFYFSCPLLMDIVGLLTPIEISGVNISHENQNYSKADPENFKTFPNKKIQMLNLYKIDLYLQQYGTTLSINKIFYTVKNRKW